ncbi:MAG: amino acid adenylation domain-containing protein [Verrucomicrobiota bacterium]
METNILEFFENGAIKTHHDKVGFADLVDELTFADIERHAKNIATRISSLSTETNCPIGVSLPKSAKTLVADLGILYSGNFFMNLDDAAPAMRTKHILENIDPLFIITQQKQAGKLLDSGYPPARLLFIEDLFIADAIYDNSLLLDRIASQIDTDPVCIINTSGSTGIPKSVALSHRGLIDFINWWRRRFNFTEHEVVGSLSPFFFDGYIVGFLMTLLKGARLEVLPTEHATFPVKLVQYMAEKRVTFIFWVPSIMVTIANFRIFETIPLPDLKTVCFAGEVLPTRHLNHWRTHLSQAEFINLYGPIEISVICTYYVVDREFRDDEPLPIGYACCNTEILILTDENQKAAQNEQGEICVRGGSLAHGYWNNPDATARALVQNPLNSHYPELIYRTGDVGYRNERGEIMFVGRKDFQVKHMGIRFDLGEIEHFVLQIDGIDYACVCYQSERKEIHLFFEANRLVAASEIREALAIDLPKHMWPTHSHQIDSLPKNPTGKIDRNKLAGTLA